MSSQTLARFGGPLAAVVAAFCFPQPAYATRYEDAKSHFDSGAWTQCIALLTAELDEHPGHEVARILLGKAYEADEEWPAATTVWEDLLKIAQNEAHRGIARKALLRLRRKETQERDRVWSPGSEGTDSARPDPFHIEMPSVQWEDIETVESDDYENNVPPFHYASKHFDVFSTNEKLSEVIAERSEIYLKFMTESLFGGRSWGFRLPIFCYATEEDYIRVGGAPGGSHGVTYGSILGKSRYVMIFHRLEITDENDRKREVMYEYAIDSILQHELTHVMINEFFGGQEIPQWLHEAVAGRMELTRHHYEEAARLARAVVAGEHFRFRDLFEQEGYPSSRIGLFYEQSAIIVLYLFEAGPEAMYTFFSELAQQHTHDEALAAALGIPEEGAVEEFERMWVEWMKRRYVQDLKPDPGEKVEIELAVAIETNTFDPPVNESGAIETVTDWRRVPTESLSDDFCGIGATLDDWATRGGRLQCNPPKDGFGGAYLGIRMYEKLPLAVRCTVRSEGDGWAGFALLDSAKNETGIEVLGRVEDGRTHELVALLGDELAIYVDGVCTGRYPRPQQNRLDAAIDFPLALVAYSSLEITKLEVAHIDKFDIAEPDEDEDNGNRGRGRGRSNSRGGRRPGRPPN